MRLALLSMCVAALLPAQTNPAYTYRLETVIGADPAQPVPAGEWNGKAAFLGVANDGTILVAESSNLSGMTLPRIGRDGMVRSSFLFGSRPFCSVANRFGSITRRSSMAVAPDGTVYLGLAYCEQIYRVLPGGEMQLFAGGEFGYSPDNIPAKDVRFQEVLDIACDKDGNVYVLDAGRVRKIDRQGMVRLYAGGGANTGENIPATEAGFFQATSMALDPAGKLYISDLRTGSIKQVSTEGRLTTFKARVAFSPFGLWQIRAAGAAGLVALSTSGTFALIDPAGKETVLPATTSQWNVFAIRGGNEILYPALNGGVAGMDLSGRVTPVAGTGNTALDVGDLKHGRLGSAITGAAASSQGLWITTSQPMYLLSSPSRLATILPFGSFGTPVFDSTESLYFRGNFYNLEKLDSSRNGARTRVAGRGGSGYAGDGGPATAAVLSFIEGIALSPAGDSLYIADSNGRFGFYNFAGLNPQNRIRRIDLKSGAITTFAGGVATVHGGDGGPAAQATFGWVSGVATDAQGNVYVADRLANRIRRIDSNGIVSTFAGTGAAGSTGDGGPATAARIAAPTSIAADALGNVYFTEQAAYRIRMVDRRGIIRTIAGTGRNGPYTADGTPATEANLDGPSGIAVMPDGTIYFADGTDQEYTRADGSHYYDDNAWRLRRLAPERTEFPRLAADGVVHGATARTGAVAPGMIAVAYGSNLGPASLAGTAFAGTRLGARAGGTAVLFDGVPAPMLYAQAGQVSFIVPYSVAGKAQVNVTVDVNGAQSVTQAIDVVAARPGLFTANSSGTGAGAILNEDGSVNSAANPAAAGSIVVLFGTGEGTITPAVADGQLATGTPPRPVAPVAVTICGEDAPLLYAGTAPQAPAGLLQVNARVPLACAGRGAVPVVLTIGGASSPPGVTVAVASP